VLAIGEACGRLASHGVTTSSPAHVTVAATKAARSRPAVTPAAIVLLICRWYTLAT